MLRYLELAAEVAVRERDPHRKSLVGAVAVRRDGTIVASRNGSTPSPTARLPRAHAEARVLRKAGRGAIVYVARVRRDGAYALARPCANCWRALRFAGVKAIYWTVSPLDWEGHEL